MADIAVDPVIHSLCLQQMAPWLGAPIDRAHAKAVYHQLNATVRSIFLFQIADGQVALLDKPGFQLLGTLNDSSAPEPEGRVIYHDELIRANLYRGFFERCLSACPVAVDMLVAVDVNDAPIGQAEAPVLAFQKLAGSNTVLIPDVDFLHYNFYIRPEYQDLVPFAEKQLRAVFAGSTTGGRTISAQDVSELRIERLRSGVFFIGSDQVDFRIPRIVQCESAGVAEMIAELGIDNTHCSWEEQFRYRFILSMDGNGATCSRVVIGLLSQAALVKYDSPHLLYYFGALTPWQHFIPVAQDQDVVDLVEAERGHRLLLANVASEGAAFARRYLGRRGVSAYFTELLRLLQACFADVVAERPVPPAMSAPEPLLELGAHIQGIGDIWGWPGEWLGEMGSGRAVEAITLAPADIARGAITCRVLFGDGTVREPLDDSYVYGTKGQDKPLYGFELQLREDDASGVSCYYSGHFMDGETVGPLMPGQMCKSPNGAALEAFEIVIGRAPRG